MIFIDVKTLFANINIQSEKGTIYGRREMKMKIKNALLLKRKLNRYS